jgi:hypothetical protein
MTLFVNKTQSNATAATNPGANERGPRRNAIQSAPQGGNVGVIERGRAGKSAAINRNDLIEAKP